ncbi:hypothetical protein G7Y89_g13143 [Cudoniella acicularis]|uniref:Hypercellular protein HypA n=1 Tax=Cudoniella acicularis TaxID=354080 RepID=A0A8H4RBA1_9HELO|nr:hypothetical protein G7Y89_g13143 [Cudoniella acicularis]
MLDQLSPVAPARVRVVLLPIGQIKRARFLSFVERLRPENVVQLGDISPDGRPHRNGAELDRVPYRGNNRRSVNGNGPPKPEHNLRELYQDLEDVRDRYPKGLVHQLLLFDYVHASSAGSLPEGLIPVPPPAECRRTTMKTIMCDISSLLLAEMTTLAKSLQALNTIESPNQSQLNRQYNGTAWQLGQAEMASRRNSQYSLPGSNSRSGSPAGSTDRSHVRMSMPAQLRSADSNSSTPSARPSTPNNGLQSELPTTFDQIVGSNSVDARNSQRTIPARLANAESVRDTSRDRVPVQGFGPGSVSERSRNIGKGRIGIVIGSLYLQAGRWMDALKELTEAGTIAKYNLDHLWHAKALDYILVSMLMLAWTGMDFQIPQICYASAEKAPQSSTPGEPKGLTSSRLVSLQNLTLLLPELLDRILNLYARSANNTGESLPQFPYSESAIRFSKLLTVIHLAGGALDDDVLQLLVVATPFKKRPNILPPRLNIRPTRTEIIATLFRAFPASSSPEFISLVDRTIVLSGIASILGLLGYYRKKAMVMRELVSVLIPGLVQARIKGAAEMGVHPAAGLAALNSVNGHTNGASALDLGEGDVENGVDTFLGLLSQTYGVVTSAGNPGQNEAQNDSNEAAIMRIMENATVRLFGGQNLKLDVLRSCINLSEALPDFHGVLRFTADLLRTAGSGVAPGPRSDDASPSMTREEQVRLATNISRTLAAARPLGVKDLAAEYWDEFLTNPFIYNPFLRTPDNAAVDHLLVADEGAVFRVTLQNPYEFDVEIESIKLESEGAEFESSIQKTVIGPYRTQILTISGTPKTSGQLKITGCIIRIRGCRERRFPIFEEPWSPQSAVKIKTIGVASLFKPKDRPTSTDSKALTTAPAMVPPKAVSLGLNVIDRQPVVVVKSSTLSQSAIMVLEGERRTFYITLQNLSPNTPVDLLLFSFKDSTQAPLQTALSNRDASPAELYEYELIFARKQALRWAPKNGEKPYIAPGGISTFELELLGKPGLTNATVQIDYACLGVSHNDIQDKFHTRQVSLPLTVTVNASIELARMDVLPLTGHIPRSLWAKTSTEDGDDKITPEDYCLLLLDLRNAWPSSLNVHLNIAGGGSIEEEVLPGKTSRIMFPIPRMFLEDSCAAIPALDPSRQRQFVVSTGRVSADTERTSREAFWYREEILKILHGAWSTKNEPVRKGEIELRGIRLSQRMIEAVKIDDIGIDIFVGGGLPGDFEHFVLTDNFAELKVKISNRMTGPIYPLLRIQPSLRSQSHNASLDLTRKLVWNGILQQSLPPIPGKESIEVSIGMTAHCRGEFEVSASIEEARLHDPLHEEGNKEGTARPRANTRTMMDAVLGTKERRIWHSREPCLIVVKDEESSDDDDD